MRNYIVLIFLALASVAIIVTYDFGNPDLPYTYDASRLSEAEKVPASGSDNKVANKTAKQPRQSASPSSVPSAQKYIDPVKKVQLELAVVAAKASAECGYSSVGYRHLKPDEAAAELVKLMNSAQQPVAGEQYPPVPVMEYVLDKPSAAWQVVIRADNETKQLIINGYATDLNKPVFIERITC